MYDYFLPTVNFFGNGSVNVTGERCKILGTKKALIVTDEFLSSISDGAVERVVASLQESGIDVAYYKGVEPNPKDANVKEGLKIF